MPHCTNCGAPSYKDPCDTCQGRIRDAQERGLPPPPPSIPQPAPLPSAAQPNPQVTQYRLEDFPRYRAIIQQFHALWTGSVGAPSYNKNEWFMFLESLNEIIRGGLGQPQPLPRGSVPLPSFPPTIPSRTPSSEEVTQPMAPAPVRVNEPAQVAPVAGAVEPGSAG